MEIENFACFSLSLETVYKDFFEERAAIGYEMSRQLRITTMDTTSTKNKPMAPESMEQVLVTGMLFASHTLTTFENSDGLNALARKICLECQKKLWKMEKLLSNQD